MINSTYKYRWEYLTAASIISAAILFIFLSNNFVGANTSPQAISDPYVLTEENRNGPTLTIRQWYSDGGEIRFRQTINGNQVIDRIGSPNDIVIYNLHLQDRLNDERVIDFLARMTQCEITLSLIPNDLSNQSSTIQDQAIVDLRDCVSLLVTEVYKLTNPNRNP